MEFEEYPGDRLPVNGSLDPAPSKLNAHLYLVSEHGEGGFEYFAHLWSNHNLVYFPQYPSRHMEMF